MIRNKGDDFNGFEWQPGCRRGVASWPAGIEPHAQTVTTTRQAPKDIQQYTRAARCAESVSPFPPH